jgi:hypothetical protein
MTPSKKIKVFFFVPNQVLGFRHVLNLRSGYPPKFASLSNLPADSKSEKSNCGQQK